MPRKNSVPATEYDYKPRVHLDFSKKDTPKSFKDLSIDDEVTVVLRGKVKSLNQMEDQNSFSVEYGRIEIADNNRPASLEDAVERITS